MCSLRLANSFLRKTIVTTDLEPVREGDGFSLVGCAAEAFDWNRQKPFILLPWDQETIFYDPYSFHFAYRIKYFLN